MASSYCEETRDGHVFDVLEDETAGIRIVVSRLGAELVSLARLTSGSWSGFLYRDNETSPPSTGWANHATVMGYYLHRLRNERSIYRGKEIRAGNHGFLRTKIWHLTGDPAHDSRLTYQITRDDFSPIEYPLDVSVKLSYELEGESVRVIFDFQNHEPELTAHVGFGLHPGFASQTFDSFNLRMPAGLYRRHLTRENFLSGEIEEIRFDGGPMPFARENLPGSYILELVELADPIFTFSVLQTGRAVELGLSGVPYLTLWSDGGPFLCIEPCWGLTDHYQQRAFENKEGMQIIPPNESYKRSFTMAPHFLPKSEP